MLRCDSQPVKPFNTILLTAPDKFVNITLVFLKTLFFFAFILYLKFTLNIGLVIMTKIISLVHSTKLSWIRLPCSN